MTKPSKGASRGRKRPGRNAVEKPGASGSKYQDSAASPKKTSASKTVGERTGNNPGSGKAPDGVVKNAAKRSPKLAATTARAGQLPSPERAYSKTAEAEPGIEASADLVQTFVADDAISLTRARAYWFLGEWEKLAAISLADIQTHPDRDRLAILAACGHQQLGAYDEARAHGRSALAWGCPRQVAAQLLIAGAHNMLGRVAAITRDQKRIQHHFREAVRVGATRDVALAQQTRAIREIARLGLLPQAAGVIQTGLETVADIPDPGPRDAAIAALKSELDFLQHALWVSLRRKQLYDTGSASKDTELDRLKRISPSQLGQDLWVLERTQFKTGGFFVEFGATDGVVLSNTYLLEKEFGWSGLLAEPNPRYTKDLRQSRSVTISDACIGGRTGETVEFVFADVFGGMTRHMNSDTHGHRRKPYLTQPGRVAELKTVSLHDFLTAHGAPRDIDYISVDTEGSELEILNGFPFDRWNVRLWTVEHNASSDREKIYSLMSANGYSRIEADWDDWYYR